MMMYVCLHTAVMIMYVCLHITLYLSIPYAMYDYMLYAICRRTSRQQLPPSRPHTYTHAHIHTHTQAHIHTHTQAHIHTHPQKTRTHTQSHTHAHITNSAHGGETTTSTPPYTLQSQSNLPCSRCMYIHPHKHLSLYTYT
eukprot:GHVQ01025535.1.p1 GENE.GHVQ01025535.1~~GHVQ01025535.1.p1  ORF type:complete len:140 (-),score=31.60 GHVQ01025535.1:252-671(-)